MHTLTCRTWYGTRTTWDFTDNIERGVRLLDKTVPGWLDDIDLGTLRVGSSRACVLGQIAEARDWKTGIYSYFGSAVNRLNVSPSMYGFATAVGDETDFFRDIFVYRELTKQWAAKVRELRATRDRVETATRKEFGLAR